MKLRPVIALLVLIQIIGCATPKSEYAKAKQADTISAYNDYLQRYPHTEYTSPAKQQIESLAYKDAARENTVDGYRRFLSDFPSTQHKKTVESALDALDWESATKQNTSAAYVEYQRAHPNGAHAGEVEGRWTNLDWEAAQSTNTRTSYVFFLGKHLTSSRAAEAKVQIEQFDWKHAQNDNTLEAYQKYLADYPKGRFSSDATKSLNVILRELTAASVKDVKINIHQNSEPFFGSLQFVSDPFFQPGNLKPTGSNVDNRKPPKDHYYVIMTVDTEPQKTFSLSFELVSAKGEIINPHTKRALLGPPTWIESRARSLKLKNGNAGQFTCLWIVSEDDLQKGSLKFGERTFRLADYR